MSNVKITHRTIGDTFQPKAPQITPSSVNDLECPRKYHILRMLKQWPANREVNDRASIGDAIHDVLRGVYLRRRDSSPDMTFLLALARGAVYSRTFSRGYDLDGAVDRVCKAVQAFADSDDYEDVDGTIDLECRFECPVYHQNKLLYLMSAKLDRTIVRSETDPTTLVVRDYKTTSRRSVDLREAAIIIAVVRHKYPRFSRYIVEYDWLTPEDRIERTTISEEKTAGQLEMIDTSAVAVLTADEFPAQPGEVCVYCPLRPTCPAVSS